MTDDRRSLARHPWRRVSSRPVYVNPWISVREDVAAMPDGRHTLYGVVVSKPAVGVLGFLDEDTVVLVGQYRYVAAAFRWEIPTGAVDTGESELEAAQRELEEEAGYHAARLAKVCSFDTSKSILDETAHVYIATGLTPVSAARAGDTTEFIEVGSFPFDEAVRMVERGEIVDSITIVALLRAAKTHR